MFPGGTTKKRTPKEFSFLFYTIYLYTQGALLFRGAPFLFFHQQTTTALILHRKGAINQNTFCL